MKSTSLITCLIGCIFICLTHDAMSQSEIAIGQWKSHLSFGNSYDVTQSPRYVYSAAGQGILRVDKEENELATITRVDGLTDAEPRSLIYEPQSESLIIAYNNGNIDVMNSEGIVNMPDILNNTSIPANKFPNCARSDRHGHVYIAYDFGIVQIDPQQMVFGFSLMTPFEIYDFIEYDGRYYIATGDGIYFVSTEETVNHADLSVWNRYTEGWPPDYESHGIKAVDGQIFGDMDGSLVVIKDDEPVVIKEGMDGYSIRNISAVDPSLAVTYTQPDVSNSDDIFEFVRTDGTVIKSYEDKPCISTLHRVIKTEESKYYLAEENGLRRLDWLGSPCHKFQPTGPPGSEAFELAIRGDDLIVATGSVTNNYSPIWNTNGLYAYDDGVWLQFNDNNGFFGDTVQIYTDVVVAPDNRIMAGVYNRGIIDIETDWSDADLISHYNSCLTGQVSLPHVTISDLKYDSQGNLWISNFRSTDPLKMIDAEGNCTTFPALRDANTGELTEIAFDARGHKWIATNDVQVGIVVFDENDPSGPRIKVLNDANSELGSNVVRDIKADLDDNIWVGTDKGAVVFECAASVFDFGCNGRQPIVVVDGVPALLLENERVQAIAIDGANRKWFGTANGIFVQSPNGGDEVAHFDMSNSPLISNFIIDIAINPTTGEAFIATDRGIMSYRTDATKGGSVHAPDGEVFAFPNPVHPYYEGPIAIKGLPRDARVKITNVNGELVFEGDANGGQAIWDGTDYTGREAASGVYLVFSTSRTAFAKPDALVSKILIVR